MKYNWKVIRIVVLFTLSILQLYVYKNGQVLSDPPIKISDILLINMSIFIGLPILIIIDLLFRNKIKSIKRINWYSPLFMLSQPIQFFNYTGWISFAAFLLPTIHSFMMESKYFLDNILLLSMGLTIMGTTYLLDFLVEKYKLKSPK